MITKIFFGIATSAMCLFSSLVHADSAVAIDKVALKFGYCHSRPNMDDARNCALATCAKGGGKSCRILDSFDTGVHGAIAVGQNAAIGYHVREDSQEMANREALSKCWMDFANSAGCDALEGQCQLKSSCSINATWSDTMTKPRKSPTGMALAVPNQGSRPETPPDFPSWDEVMNARDTPPASMQTTPAQPAAISQPVAKSPQPPVPTIAKMPPGGYQTCSLPANRVVNRDGKERPMDAAYDNVCLSILPPTCRNWVVDKKPCAVRACVVDMSLSRCPNGDITAYVARETLPFTQADFAMMNAQINAEAQRIAAQRGGNPAPGAAADAQYWQTQLLHRGTEYGNGGAGGVTYNGR